jgi:type 1 fimbriae regulatory protein FimE
MHASAAIIELPQTSFSGKMPRKPKNKDVRTREFLTPSEIDDLMLAAGRVGRHPHRDKALILIAFRHALRVSELVSLKWQQIDFKSGQVHVVRLKGGIDSTHPLRGVELRALRKLQRSYPAMPYVFVSERGTPLTTSAVRKMIARAGEGLPFPVHPHMLRHACGYKLANEGHDTRAIQMYMGHSNIQHTCRYTELAANRFNGFWTD